MSNINTIDFGAPKKLYFSQNLEKLLNQLKSESKVELEIRYMQI